MYCIKCGVKLADSEKKCPLCGTVPYHPEILPNSGKPTYRPGIKPKRAMNKYAVMVLSTVLFVIVVLQLALCDKMITGNISWSFYASGAITLFYIWLMLPLWFRKPNPVIFVPCDFLAAALYLFGVNYYTSGNWFWSFALPVSGIACLIVTAVVALCYYLKKGYYFIFGGAIIGCGVFAGLLELFIYLTFDISKYYFWAIYPFSACLLLGMALIVIGICPGFRDRVQKKFFI